MSRWWCGAFSQLWMRVPRTSSGPGSVLGEPAGPRVPRSARHWKFTGSLPSLNRFRGRGGGSRVVSQLGPERPTARRQVSCTETEAAARKPPSLPAPGLHLRGSREGPQTPESSSACRASPPSRVEIGPRGAQVMPEAPQPASFAFRSCFVLDLLSDLRQERPCSKAGWERDQK